MQMVVGRVPLVRISTLVLHRSGQPLVDVLGSNARATPDAAGALVELGVAIDARGGQMRVNQALRDYEMQAQFRADYLAGKGPPAQPPGDSVHEGGRAFDLSTVIDERGQGGLRFPVPSDRQIDVLWECARPLGFRPVIDRPDETKVERWHLDYWGPWEPVRARLGYAAAARCAILDLGASGDGPRAWGVERAMAMALQAQLHRAGYDVGALDGLIGKRTTAALVACGAGATCRDPAALYALPSSATRWS